MNNVGLPLDPCAPADHFVNCTGVPYIKQLDYYSHTSAASVSWVFPTPSYEGLYQFGKDGLAWLSTATLKEKCDTASTLEVGAVHTKCCGMLKHPATHLMKGRKFLHARK